MSVFYKKLELDEEPNIMKKVSYKQKTLEGSHFIKTIRISNYSELSISYVNYVVV